MGRLLIDVLRKLETVLRSTSYKSQLAHNSSTSSGTVRTGCRSAIKQQQCFGKEAKECDGRDIKGITAPGGARSLWMYVGRRSAANRDKRASDKVMIALFA